jgi:ElaB/YqjD/DUF883 family membrane-anchored ribosome-binding protein
MKDLQKIKEFFSKPVNEAIATPMDAIEFLNANKNEIIKLADQYKGDVMSMQKAIDAFLAPHIEGTPDFIVNKVKAAIGGAISKRNIAADPKLSATYDKLKNVKGVVNEETAVDMAKKRLDALGVKYEMSKTDKVRPFKVIYKPINKSDKFYDEFEDIVDLFNLKGFVKTSMNEAKEEDIVDTITMDIPLFLRMLEYSREDAKKDLDLHDVTEKANKLGKERGILSMDDYEEIVGAAEEIDEAVNLKASKLSSAEYQKAKKLKDFKSSDWKWNADEDLYTKVNEAELNEAKSFTIDSESASDSDKITDFLTSNNIKFTKIGSKIKISLDRDTPKASVILSKLRSLSKFDELNEAELSEAYVPSNIKEFAKRKGVSSLVNKVAGWAEKVGKGIRGGTAIGYNYSTLILDMTYQGSEIRINTDDDTVTLYDEPVRNFNEFQRVYADGEGNNLEERISEALNKINEELCPAGKAYIKRRQAAGEKSSAYLSGRAVKVCKGQMSGRAKKK